MEDEISLWRRLRVSWFFSVVLPLKGYGAFTFYTGFDVAVSTPGGTVGRYGRPALPLVVKSWRGQKPDPASLVMTPARFLPLNSYDLL